MRHGVDTRTHGHTAHVGVVAANSITGGGRNTIRREDEDWAHASVHTCFPYLSLTCRYAHACRSTENLQCQHDPTSRVIELIGNGCAPQELV